MTRARAARSGRRRPTARIPALRVAVHRADRPLWTFTVGTSGDPASLDAGTLFRIGSITKTFTAVLVLQCRDEGLLDLDDPIARAPRRAGARRADHPPAAVAHRPGCSASRTATSGTPCDAPGRRRSCSPSSTGPSGCCRRPAVPLLQPGLALLGQLVGAAARRHLGRGAGRADPRPARAGRRRRSTPGRRGAVGYLVDAYSDHARPEPPTDFGGGRPGRASSGAPRPTWPGGPRSWPTRPTVDPAGAVLAAATVEEMRWPLTVTDEALWAVGLRARADPACRRPRPGRPRRARRRDARLPGRAPYGRRGGAGTPGALGAAVLGSSGTAAAIVELPHDLLRAAVERRPGRRRSRGRPGEPAPPSVPVGARAAGGARASSSSSAGTTARCRPAGPTTRRAGRRRSSRRSTARPTCCGPSPGREVGERLRLHPRPGTATVVRMHWATYRFTRTQETFDGA